VTAMIRVAIVDDEGLLRSGLQLIIDAAEGLRTVCSCSGADALEMLPQAKADVLLLDIRMPGIDGLTILRELGTWEERPAVAILTTFVADELIAQALQAGAAGYLLKDTDPDDLTAAIRSLAAGRSTLSPQVTRTVIDGYLNNAHETQAAGLVGRLSPREREILVLLADGLSNGQIAERLHLSPSTVKDYVSAVLGKLETTNRVQAAVLAHRAGLAGKPQAPE
jgi:DNA-binding NarL/FixJ family response regulator